MRDRHEMPLRDTQYQFAGEIDWYPRAKWPAWVRLALLVVGSLVCWAAVAGFAFMLAALAHSS